MTSTATNAWMTSGRHNVNVGASLTRMLKARKGGAVKTSSSAKPVREFYSVRYNFKPESVDPTKPGSIEVKKPKEEGGPTSVSVTRPSTQNEYGVNYIGQERASREYDCVLIIDEELGTITLEKLESNIVLHHDPRTHHVPRHANSPAPPAPQRLSASTSASSSHAPQDRPPALKREEEEESEGEIPEPPKSKPPSRPTAPTSQPKTKPPAPAPQPAPQAAPRSLPPSLPPKPAPTVVPPKPKPRPVTTPASTNANGKGPKKRELPADAEETLEVRRPAQAPPPKKAKVVPEKKKEPVALALPGSGSSSGIVLPSASNSSVPQVPAALSLPDSSTIVSLPSAPAAPALPPPEAVIDSDEEDWDEVPPTITSATAAAPLSAAAPLPPRVIMMEEIEPEPSPFSQPSRADDVEEVEIDMAAFEEELKEQLGEPEPEPEPEADEDDFLAGAMSPEAERQPVSLSAFVGGGGADFGDDDDYSSSDDSDDD
ncbi:RNA polymerase II transcription elongation factor-domain-containing protein [Trametes maxima]|nr:RNA polymerase II transcription elongation factor-domain-containing protein [Trametes maxima]